MLSAVCACTGYAQIVAVSAASYQAPVAPASMVSLFGTSLSKQTVKAQPDASGQLPVELGGVSIQVGGQAVQLLYASPSQINFVMPAAIASGTADIVLQPAGTRTTVEVRNTAPGLFSMDASGAGAGAILNGVTFAFSPFLVETPENLGDDKRTRLSIFGTGIRYAGNPFLDPSVTNAARSVTAQAGDAAGNIYALPVEYAGPAPVYFGFDQVNVVLPPQLDGIGAVSLTVTAGGVSSNVVTARVNALPDSSIALVGVSLAQNSISSGASVAGTVTLNAPARSGGFSVALASSGNFVQTPGSVIVPQGQVSASFTLQATTSGAGSATLTASANGVSRGALLIVNSANAPSLSAVTLAAASAGAGASVNGTVTLSGPAPNGGAVVQLSADSSFATPPATVTVPSGQSSVSFTLTTTPVTAAQTVTLTAAYSGATRTVTLKLNPVLTFAIASDSVLGGQIATATVTLATVAQTGGAIVNLASSDPLTARVDPFVIVPAGQTTASANITTSAVLATRTVTLTATYAGVSQTATLGVVPAGTASLAALSIAPAAVKGGTAATGTITLTAPAASPFGTTVTLQSDNKLAVQLAASVIVPAGQTTATFAVNTNLVTSAQTVTLTASAGGVSKTATLTVQ